MAFSIGMSQPAMTLLEVFPPGRRRRMVMELAKRPELDEPQWTGWVKFRCFRTDKAGKPGLAIKLEPDEETVL